MKTFTPLVALCCALLSSLSIQAQNLVPNYSFEDFTNCPTIFSQLNFAPPWITPTGGTSDYFNACSNGTPVDVPTNFAGNQMPSTGDGYAGGINYIASFTNYREYVQIQLTEPLEPGFCYQVNVQMSLGDQSSFAIDNMGIHLSNGPVGNIGQIDAINVTPQFVQTTPLNNPDDWTNIGGTYIAVGGENYITIGCFVNDNQLTIENRSGTNDFAYYYIDDVEVILMT